MKKVLRIATIAMVISIMATLLLVAPVSATALPDSTPTVQGFWVFRNLLETNDWLILIYFNIPYSTPPSEPIWQTFMWRMLTTDNTTELGVDLPTAYNNNGYGYNLSSIYFNAANVTALGLVWNTAYPLRLSCNPASFTAPTTYNFTLDTSDYTTENVTANVQEELAATIITLGAELDIRWGLSAVYSLLSETATGTILSIYGESFFRAAIYGLQGLCPRVFAYIVEDIDLTARTFGDTYINILDVQYQGSWAQVAKDAGAALFGTDFDLTAIIVSLGFIFIIGGCTIVVSGDAWHGIPDARTGLIAMTRLGFFGLAMLGLIAAMFAIYGLSRLWGVLR
jgi:hypothetical protein